VKNVARPTHFGCSVAHVKKVRWCGVLWGTY
jgi:hypothetical protein